MDEIGTSFNEQFENSFKCHQANEAMNKVKYLSLLFPMQYVGCFYCAAKHHQCQWYFQHLNTTKVHLAFEVCPVLTQSCFTSNWSR